MADVLSVVFLALVWGSGFLAGRMLRTAQVEADMFEAQRLRDEAWDLAHGVDGKDAA